MDGTTRCRNDRERSDLARKGKIKNFNFAKRRMSTIISISALSRVHGVFRTTGNDSVKRIVLANRPCFSRKRHRKQPENCRDSRSSTGKTVDNTDLDFAIVLKVRNACTVFNRLSLVIDNYYGPRSGIGFRVRVHAFVAFEFNIIKL